MLRNFVRFALPSLLFATSFAHAESGLETAVVSREMMAQEQILDGVVEAVNQSTVAAQVTGRITEIHFDVDDVVDKGSVLLRIHDKEYRARLKQAEAGLAEAKALLKDAEAEHKRIEGLYKDKMVSESEFDKAAAGLKSAQAKTKAAEGQLVEAQEQMENTMVRAPYSGIVVKRHVQPGETVRVGDPVMTGFSLAQLRVNVDVPQAHINAVRQYKSASVVAPDGTTTLHMQSMTIFPYADATSHTFRVRVDLAEGAAGIYPGMLVKAKFKVDEKARLLVPTSAVARRVEVEAVYVIDNAGTIRMRQVRAGRAYDDKTEILAGLDEGENVALDPVRAAILLKESVGAAQ